jgi:hypothetical protein
MFFEKIKIANPSRSQFRKYMGFNDIPHLTKIGE